MILCVVIRFDVSLRLHQVMQLMPQLPLAKSRELQSMFAIAPCQGFPQNERFGFGIRN